MASQSEPQLLPAIMVIKRGDVAYMLVFVWGLVMIAVRQSDNPALSTAAFSLVIINLVVLGVTLWQRRLKTNPR